MEEIIFWAGFFCLLIIFNFICGLVALRIARSIRFRAENHDLSITRLQMNMDKLQVKVDKLNLQNNAAGNTASDATPQATESPPIQDQNSAPKNAASSIAQTTAVPEPALAPTLAPEPWELAELARRAGSEPRVLPELAPEIKPKQTKENSFAAEPVSTIEVTTTIPAAMPSTIADDFQQTTPFPESSTEPVLPWLIKAKNWLLKGNLITKLGLLILFTGICFLLKYVNLQIHIPIELRLAGIVLVAVALLAWGWRIRNERPGISLPVQGVSLAILMLVTFGALRFYHLIPGSVAFFLMVVLTAFTCLLSVLQNAPWLATYGIVGGFAVPFLASTGGGSHIALFSYYAVLNAGILLIATKRAWRVLNLLGFVCTFVLSTAWGVLQYSPELYLSTQLFLILFFGFYVAISVANALHQGLQLSSYIDATLVFGTPLLALGIESALVKEMPYGLSFSALVLGLFYMTLALCLHNRRSAMLKTSVEVFFALGVVLGNLAVPLALGESWTSSAWALEGVALVWLGLRQQHVKTWTFGLLLQAGAFCSFWLVSNGINTFRYVGDNAPGIEFLVPATIALLVLVAAFPRSLSTNTKRWLLVAAFSTVLVALLAGNWFQFVLDTDFITENHLGAYCGIVAAIVIVMLAARVPSELTRLLSMTVQTLAAIFLLSQFKPWETNFHGFPVASLLLGACLLCSCALLHRHDGSSEQLKILSRNLLPWVGFYWFALILNSAARFIMDMLPAFRPDTRAEASIVHWSYYVLLLALSTPALCSLARRLQWPALRWFTAPVWLALGLISFNILLEQYELYTQTSVVTWTAFATVWLAGEYLMLCWPVNGWHISIESHELLHTVRTAAPWLMVWPVATNYISTWLMAGKTGQQQLLEQAGWHASGSWARYLPMWAMMLVIACLIRRCRSGLWPLYPIPSWYQRVLIPLATAWSILTVAQWNLYFNGAMAPLPYLPILNPLDLTTGFALLLGVASYRLVSHALIGSEWPKRLPFIFGSTLFVWFNLILLRTACNYAGLHYDFDTLIASFLVQAMLSILWSATALVLMLNATRKGLKQQWRLGAILLAIVVLKLFLIDLAGAESIERIVSFVGVGLLMVTIDYLAPYPGRQQQAAESRRKTS